MSCMFITSAFSITLSDTVFVNQTSETASTAKNIAMNNARRQILFNVLSQYTDKDEISELIKKSSNEELMNIILSTSVANEQISSDTYSANITMDIDNEAAKRWLGANNIRQWVPALESVETFTASIVVLNGIVDLAELKRITRDNNVIIDVQSITGNQIVVKMPLNYRSRFTTEIHSLGWKYTDNGGVLQVWK
nr:hypothetical protein [Candidatus Enterousia merdequi]